MNKLSIIIPAYNEEKRLPNTLDNIAKFVKNKKYNTEIIVVLEKCTDNTVNVLKKYEEKYPIIRHLQNEKKMGKGYTVRKGVLAAEGDVILFTDADLSVPIDEVNKMLIFLETSYDCCIGDRIQVKKQPFYRIFSGTVFRFLSRMITGLPYRDTQCGFKIFNRNFAKKVFGQMTVDGFAFDVEMLMLAKKMGFKTKAIKVRWFNNKNTTVSLFKDSFDMFKDLILIGKMK